MAPEVNARADKRSHLPQDAVDEKGSQDVEEIWNKVYIATKVIFTGFLFLLVLGSAVVSKGSLLMLAWNVFTPNNTTLPSLKTLGGHFLYSDNQGTHRQEDTERLTETNLYFLWALFLLVASSSMFSFIVNLWKLLSKKSDELKWIPLIIALVSALLHSIGLSIFVFSLLPAFDPISGVLYGVTITFVPTLVHLIFSNKNFLNKQSGVSTKLNWPFLRRILAFVLSVTSLIFWCVHISSASIPSVSGARLFMFIVSPIFASCGWWDNYLPGMTNEEKEIPEKEEEANYINRFRSHLNVLKDQSYTGRYKINLIVNIWKVLIIFVMLVGIHGSKILNISSLTQVTSAKHVSSVFGSSQLYKGEICASFKIAVVGMFANVFCHRLSLAAIKIVAQIQGFALPIALTTPVTALAMYIVSVQLQEGTNVCSFPFPWWDKEGSTPGISCMVLGSVTGYISLLLLTSNIWTNSIERMMKGNEIYIKPLYCASFLDQSLMLNRRMDTEIVNETPSNLNKADRKKSSSEGSVPKIYMCATMWHESEAEMIQLLKSLFRTGINFSFIAMLYIYRYTYEPEYMFRMDIDQWRCREHTDKYNIEAHIFFDDAFTKSCTCANEYVQTLVKAMESMREAYGTNKTMMTLKKADTPYGGQLKWKLPHGNNLIVHLKDEKKIRKKKRWSQVMYMYYFLSHKLGVDENDFVQLKERAKNIFILALDGDVDFRPEAVKLLVDRMQRNEDVGAACGRILPIGEGPMVWYQKFEYAVSHWLVKATEHVTGCVLCSPGCFSLFRGSSLMDDNVLKVYTTLPTEARHHIQYDQGEDRWLCTLLLKQGYKVDYCAASDAYTFAPEDFKVFYNQRRRWTPSTMANIMDLLSDWRTVIKKNNYITLPFIALQTFWFLSSLVTPGVLMLMIIGAINLVYPNLSLTATLLLNLIPIVVFVLLCFFGNTEYQLNFAAALSVVYSLVMMIVLITLIKQSVDQGFCSITTPFFLSVCGIFLITGIMHPKEMSCLLHGLLFFVAIPSMSILLMIYSIINMNNVSWGTREAVQISEKGQRSRESNAFQSLFETFSCFSTPPTTDDVEKAKQKDEHVHDDDSLTFDANDTKQLKSRKEITFWQWLICRYLHPSGKVVNTNERNGEIDTTTTRKHFQENRANNADYKELNEEKLTDGSTEKGATKERLEEIKDVVPDKEQEKRQILKEENERIRRHVDIKKKELELKNLRNKASLAFLLINGIFTTIIFFLQQINADDNGDLSIQLTCSDGRHLNLEPISMTFTFVFGVLLTIQFVCMLVHRFKTFLQINSITKIRQSPVIDTPGMDIQDNPDTDIRSQHVASHDNSAQNEDTIENKSEQPETIDATKKKKSKRNKEKNKKNRGEEKESCSYLTSGKMPLENSIPPLGHYEESFTRSHTSNNSGGDNDLEHVRERDKNDSNDERIPTKPVQSMTIDRLARPPLPPLPGIVGAFPGRLGPTPLSDIPRRKNSENPDNTCIPPVHT